MRKFPLIFLSAMVSFISPINGQRTAVENEPPTVEVISPTDASDLAQGYESAFQQMSASRVVIYVQMEERIQKLEFVRDVNAAGGVLVIELRDNNLLAVDARRIVLMTDGKMTP